MNGSEPQKVLARDMFENGTDGLRSVCTCTCDVLTLHLFLVFLSHQNSYRDNEKRFLSNLHVHDKLISC